MPSSTVASSRRFLAGAVVAFAAVLPAASAIAGGEGAATRAAVPSSLPVTFAPRFLAVGPMGTARAGHTVSVLPDGNVLVAGGTTGLDAGDAAPTDMAEVFDRARGAFVATPGPMTVTRSGHTATVLPNGTVLLAGGTTGGGPTATAELFDPATGAFAATAGAMSHARAGHTATLLPDGLVLVAGGPAGAVSTAAAELFDPATGTFAPTAGPMTAPRARHTATLLPGGAVLIAGGTTGVETLASAEVYDHATRRFTAATLTMSVARRDHTATLLPGGLVLLAGGWTASAPTDEADLLDPAGATRIAIRMGEARSLHTATLLADGLVLLVGGGTGSEGTAEVFDPAAPAFVALTGTRMVAARAAHAAALLPCGRVLMTGGRDGDAIASSAELFDASSPVFTRTADMTVPREHHTATLLPDGTVLVAGGFDAGRYAVLDSADIYDPVTGAFTATPGRMDHARRGHTATLLLDGTVLLAGGAGNTAEIFDPAMGTFSPARGPMVAARTHHTATLLAGGVVLLTGGVAGSTSAPTNTAEVFDPATGTFAATASTMGTGRANHTATLLPGGRVLIAGGRAGAGSPPTAAGLLDTAEVFDPATGEFLPTAGPMTTPRSEHTATRLPGGTVLLTGGIVAGETYDDRGLHFVTATNTAEVFDPLSGIFEATAGAMSVWRSGHAAALSPDSTVTVAGGYMVDLNYRTGFEWFLSKTTETFDPLTGRFGSARQMDTGRLWPTATLLRDGRILLAGGRAATSFWINPLRTTTATGGVDDGRPGIPAARRPVLSAVPASLDQPASLVVTGTGFRGDSEASGGAANSCATNYPLLQLLGIGAGHAVFPRPDPAAAWSDGVFPSETLGLAHPLPADHYRVVVVANGIASEQRILRIAPPPTTPVCLGFSLEPAAATAVEEGGAAVVTVVGSPTGCGGGHWRASGNGAWLTVWPAAGQGPGTVTVSWSRNSLPVARTGSARIAGTAFPVTQAAASDPSVTLDPIPGPIVVGAANTLTGSGFTAGSVIKLYVTTAAGVADHGPYVPDGATSTSLAWTVPPRVALGAGFGTVQVVNTDQGYLASNLQGALLAGSAAANIPTITHVNGVALAAADTAIPLAHADTVLPLGSVVTLAGTGFGIGGCLTGGACVNAFTAGGNLGPLSPLPGGTAAEVRVVLPPAAPTGPVSIVVVNDPYEGNVRSNAVAAVIGSRVTVARVTVSGTTVTVEGTGFSALSVVNFFNLQGVGVVNLGGLDAAGRARVPIAVADDRQLTFQRPPGAMPGAAFVEVLNPPFIPFSSSGDDPDGAVTLP